MEQSRASSQNVFPDSTIAIPEEGSFTLSPQQQQSVNDILHGTMGKVSPTNYHEIISALIGRYVICEFLIGTNSIHTQDGILTQVGQNYFLLFDAINEAFVSCDLYALKFVTFFPAGSYSKQQQLERRERVKRQQQNRVFTSIPTGPSTLTAHTSSWPEPSNYMAYGSAEISGQEDGEPWILPEQFPSEPSVDFPFAPLSPEFFTQQQMQRTMQNPDQPSNP